MGRGPDLAAGAKPTSESSRVVYAAILANAGIAIAKFIVAALTGSSAILSEGIHSVVDTCNEALLLLGLKRSQRSPDALHPFGHGKELYFWSLIVAVLLFGFGAGMALYEGIMHLVHPSPLSNGPYLYLVLAISAAFEGTSFAIAFRALGAHRDHGEPARWWRRIRRSKDPSVFTVFVEDFAALSGIAIAAIGITFGLLFDSPYPDGIASIVIGVMLGIVAIALAGESRGLLVGESATPEVVARIQALGVGDPAIRKAAQPRTMHMSPDELLVNMDLELDPTLSGGEQIDALERVDASIRGRFPQVTQISLQPRRHVD